ncbi:MAG TPA: glycosyltransferase [Beijerinckiaceae bacterium]|nr:glycosyltransferase [Beijerinckiaceae bacterium]
MTSKRFFYLVPAETRHRLVTETRLQHLRRLLFDRRRRYPTGGVKVIYQHCEMLLDAGFTAHPVHLGDFVIDWYDHQCRPLSVAEARAMMRADDVLVVPERLPAVAAQFTCGTKVAFVQNHGLVAAALQGRRYADFGFTDLLCCGTFVAGTLADQAPLPCHVVTNGIDLDKFVPAPDLRRPDTVLILRRKASWPLGLQAIGRLPQEIRTRLAVRVLPNTASETQMIRRYQESDIFLALGFPEGFALPPLEAMACGCVVAGFAGGGGISHMRHETSALVVPDGDVTALAAALERLAREPDLKERLRAGGQAVAQGFGLAAMRAAVLAFAETMQRRMTSS